MKRLLFQLDGDRLPSAFDRVVGYDGGADEVLSYGGLGEEDVRSLVYGAIFTRSPKELHHTAVFVGGSSMPHAERLLAEVRATFFGPFRTSVMLDPNGANTTAAAAVRKVAGALDGGVGGRRVVVLAGTGPVGMRVAGLLATLGAEVRLTSRTPERGEAAAGYVQERFGVAVEPVVVGGSAEPEAALAGAVAVVACGPVATRLLPREAWVGRAGVRVLADLNAVPPLGIDGVEANDDGREQEGVVGFGALAIGTLKMALHRSCIRRLFEANDRVYDAETIYELGEGL